MTKIKLKYVHTGIFACLIFQVKTSPKYPVLIISKSPKPPNLIYQILGEKIGKHKRHNK